MRFSSRRIITILFLSFSSGLPLALTNSTLQAWYTDSGASLITIGALTLVGQPYIYKFLWAPLCDWFTPLRLGKRRGWILLTQIGLSFSLVTMAFLNPKNTPLLLAIIAIVAATFSATQDIAVDAYRTDLLPNQERGLGATASAIGYRIGMLVAQSLALILAAQIGWRLTYLIMAGMIALEILVTTRYAPTPHIKTDQAQKSDSKSRFGAFSELLQRDQIWVWLIFISCYHLCDAFALSLNTPFLLRGLGFSLTIVGSVSKGVGTVATILGSVLGGLFLNRLGLYWSLMVFGFLQMVSNLGFAILAWAGKSYLLMTGCIFAEHFCSGLTNVAFVVLLMSLCDHRYTATQYALFSALAALGRVLVGPIAAWVVVYAGWAHFYIWSMFMGVPGLLILWWLNHFRSIGNKIDTYFEEIKIKNV